MGKWKKLDKMDLADGLDEDTYEERLHQLQFQLLRIQQWLAQTGGRAIVAIEGWDAAGKGGLIKRMTERLDPRPLHVWQIAAPSLEEQGKHYLYRFWQKLPESGAIAIFDRTWYGRVLVERIEGYAPKEAWRRAYDEINEFERLLTDDGVRMVKLLLHISTKEQRKRIIGRLDAPEKRFKVTMEDFRNMQKRAEYLEAFDDMLERTDTDHAPWAVIATDSKRRARIEGIDVVAKALAKGADLVPPALDPEVARAAMEQLGWDPAAPRRDPANNTNDE
ncbi:polyphosphate kinase [Vineibacter terrae]|uniref:Polyphosphate kinase n=1 Tax=Vineibacter terrae TaxID=2586908 RepID=A0A5C8PAF5_9HYPH|nr:polyphosphate kinase [Vineibacter terrae]TXL70663.1 polyphosphate kinase [Vineibacter terrae]